MADKHRSQHANQKAPVARLEVKKLSREDLERLASEALEQRQRGPLGCHCRVTAELDEFGEFRLKVSTKAVHGRDADGNPLYASETDEEFPEEIRERVREALAAALEDTHEASSERAVDAAAVARAHRRMFGG